MEQRFILYALLFGSGMLLFQLLRQKYTDGGRALQAGVTVALSLAALTQQKSVPSDVDAWSQPLLYGASILSFVLLVVSPALLARSALKGSGRGYGLAVILLPYFWWGKNGTALQKIARAHHALLCDDIAIAKEILEGLASERLSPGLRSFAMSLDVLLSATLFQWTTVLEKVARAPNHPGGQLPAARAFGELGQPTAALNVLRILLLRPSTSQALPQFYGAELCAYCAAGDMESVQRTIARIADDGVEVPPGYNEYWIGRCHHVLGETDKARPYLQSASRLFQEASARGDHFVGLKAAQRFVEHLTTNPITPRKMPDDDGEYQRSKATYLNQLGPMRPWFQFLSGSKSSPVTMTFILVCGLLIAPMYAGQLDLYYRLLERFANYSPYVLGDGQYYRILTANFLHVGLVHFSFNAFALYLFGRPVERTWGRMTTFWVLLLSGIGGHYVSALFHPNSASVGASTSVYGILALYVLTFVRYRAPGLDRFRNRRIIFLLMLILCDIGLSLTEPMIDTPGHLGGLFVGTLLGMGIIVGDSRRQKKRAGGNPPTPP